MCSKTNSFLRMKAKLEFEESMIKKELEEPDQDLLSLLLEDMGDIVEEIKEIDRENEDLIIIKKEDIIEEVEFDLRVSPIMEVLAIIGIESENNAEAVFHPEIGLLTGLGEYDNLYYEGKRIEDIDIPKIGAEKITSRILNNSIVVDSNIVYGDLRGDNYIIGMQEKIDGFSACIFRITLEDKRMISFYWDNEIIAKLNKDYRPGLFEKVGDTLYVINLMKCRYQDEEIEISTKVFKIVEKKYEYLTQEALEYYKSKEGVILNINGLDYKCPNERVVTLYSDGLHITDKQGRWRDYYEKGAKIKSERKGCLDFRYDNGFYSFVRWREDKEVPDSGNAIEQIIKDMVVLSELERFLIIPKKRKESKLHMAIDVIQVNQVSDKIIEINKRIKENKIALVYSQDRISSSRDVDIMQMMKNKYSVELFTIANSNYYYLGGMTRKKYRMRKEKKWKKGKLLISNVWKPGSLRILISNLQVFGKETIQDIPGVGLVSVVYYSLRE